MYKVYINNTVIYDTRLDDLKIFGANYTGELNSVGSFTFTIYPNHPCFELIQKLNNTVRVYQDDRQIFSGRILNDVNGVRNEKLVTCESDLAYLLDTVQRPWSFEGTPAELFRRFITEHNLQVEDNKKFKVGNITVTDPNEHINRSDDTYMTTLDSIQKKLIDDLQGYLVIRYEEDGTYIDYLEELNTLSNQTIEFGENLLDIKTTVNAADIFTVIIPVGAADEEGNKVNIKSVNDNKDYLENTEAIAKYGRIVKMVEWSDVSVPSNLKTKAQAYLNNAVLLENTLELSAADLSSIKADISCFHLGSNVRIISKPHNIDTTLLIKKLSLDLMNPANSKLSLGSKYYSMSDLQHNEIKNITSQVVTKVEEVKVDVIAQTTKQFQADIQSTSESIMSNVAENYYLKGETDQLVSSVSTSLEQTASSFEMRFNTFSTDLEALANGTDAEFESIRKYIRFDDGKIILGEVGNSLELQIANDRIKFMQNNSEVAYFSNNKLYVTDGEYTNSLQLGKFAFLPRTNGNLSFKKVSD